MDRIYVASSWRCEHQPIVITRLRAEGFSVYDFRHPTPDDDGFHWSEIDPNWRSWTPEQYREGLKHPIAVRGLATDFQALVDCDICVLVQPCGRSAHLELGWALGAGKRGYVLTAPGQEVELMVGLAHGICCSLDELVTALKTENRR